MLDPFLRRATASVRPIAFSIGTALLTGMGRLSTARRRRQLHTWRRKYNSAERRHGNARALCYHGKGEAWRGTKTALKENCCRS